ncbi:MAG: carboxypeptidase M32 [Bacteroidetes bacterium]|nr:carboxypeptidase M32 [Bacteroidota bacterium]
MIQNYENYRKHMAKVADINYSCAMLGWDQETYMPEGASDLRSRQLSTLSGLAHQLFTDAAFGDLLATLKDDTSLSAAEKSNVLNTIDDYKKQTCLSTDFVEAMSKAISQSFNAWQKARQDNNFKLFAPHLKEIIALKKEETSRKGYTNVYDGMLDTHEKGLTIQKLDALFSDVREQLVPFIKKIAASKQVDDAFMFKQYPSDLQWQYSLDVLKHIGFDFNTGRQDKSTHPFTTSFGSADVRVTTRISEHDLSEIIWSTIHEGGHALYEQGLPVSEYGLPASEAAGLGLHESQSRLWENNVGRSLPFWENQFSKLLNVFPAQLSGVSTDDFYRGMNKVQPSFIRTSADELTYHLHIMIRYEIEKAMVFDEVSVEDLPALWNSKYKSYLGIDVPDDKTGILQDVHWSHGSLGYFPTYSVGSFYAAQFFAAATHQIPALKTTIAEGNCHPLLTWLRENIHQYGRRFTSEELCKKICGEGLNFSHFMKYATEKYTYIYSL